ncbi:MAG: hypothetical protein SFW65_06115 [Alphaproteobacteria bacterium]|nr:hypothetical protein [Alphaproteobacteria bacterium]
MTFDANQQEIQEATQKTDDGFKRAGKSSDELTAKLDKLKQEFSKTSDVIKDSFAKSLGDAIKGSDTFSNAFDKIRKSLEDFTIKAAVINPLSDILFGGDTPRLDSITKIGDVLPTRGTGGLLGDLTNGIADLFGARAFGGPVAAGQPYLVGERGPELFVPQTSGRINPDVGSAVSIVMNITTNDAASFQSSQTQIAASMIDAARRAQRIR